MYIFLKWICPIFQFERQTFFRGLNLNLPNLYLFNIYFVVLFFCLLVHRLAVRISLPFLQVVIVLIQVYNGEIRHHSTVCRCGRTRYLKFCYLDNCTRDTKGFFSHAAWVNSRHFHYTVRNCTETQSKRHTRTPIHRLDQPSPHGHLASLWKARRAWGRGWVVWV